MIYYIIVFILYLFLLYLLLTVRDDVSDFIVRKTKDAYELKNIKEQLLQLSKQLELIEQTINKRIKEE